MTFIQWWKKDLISYRSLGAIAIIQGIVMTWLMVIIVTGWVDRSTINDRWIAHTRELEQAITYAQKNKPVQIVDISRVHELADMPIGIKNNNPCNVKKLDRGVKWKGEIGTDEFGHVKFSHPIWSYRAATIVLVKYQNFHQLDTLEKMMGRYCTANQKEYAEYLAKRIGIKPTEEFIVEKYLSKILIGITTFENRGLNPYPEHYTAPFTVWENLVTTKG